MHETHTITRAYYTRTRVDTPEFDNVMAAGKSGAIEVYSKSGNVVVSLCLSEEAHKSLLKIAGERNDKVHWFFEVVGGMTFRLEHPRGAYTWRSQNERLLCKSFDTDVSSFSPPLVK